MGPMRQVARLLALLALSVAGLVSAAPPARATDPPPVGQITYAVHFTLAPRWLDPGENEGTITPYMIFYAVHDALVKPMPAGPTTGSLAESWTVSPDGLVIEFLLRNGVRFHNGDPLTAEDVKFSFERYKGVHAKILRNVLAAEPVPCCRS